VSGVTTSEIEIPVAGGEALPTLLVEADASAPHGAILVVGDIGGARRQFIDFIAGELGKAGYDAIVPEFFFREGPLPEMSKEAVAERRAKLDDVRTIADLSVAIEWLRARPRFHGLRVGTIGFCLGGTFVLNLASAREDLATVCYYGFPAETPLTAGVQGPYPRDEVDRAAGPLLAFWGDQDQRAGQENIAAYIAAMEARDIDFEAVVYPGLDHAFLTKEWEQGSAGHVPAMDSWRRALAFYAAKL
jgi:carboxymethylenebutenolidase